MNHSLRSILLRLLLAGYLPFLLLLCCLVCWGIWRLGQLYWLLPNVPTLLLIGGLAATVGQVVWTSRVLFQSIDADDDLEVRLPRKQLQGLNDLIVDVARRQQLPTADQIRLSADTVAYIYENDDSESILVIGGLAIRMFSRDALAGIVAHELTHLANGDTRLARRAANRVALMAALEAEFQERLSSQVNPLVWLIRLYHLLFRIVRAAHSRAQERAADRSTAALLGKEAAAAALIRLTVTERLPYVRLTSVAKSCVATGDTLDGIFAEQQARLRSIGAGEWKEALEKELRADTDWFASHPALRDRLGALGVPPKQALQLVLSDAGAAGATLFADWARIEQDLTARVIAVYQERQEAMRTFAQIVRGRPLNER